MSGGPFGSYAAGNLADKLGRKKALAVCTWIFFLGGLMMAMAPSMEVRWTSSRGLLI